MKAFDIETFYTYDCEFTAKRLLEEIKAGKKVVNICSIAYTIGNSVRRILGVDEEKQVEFLREMPQGIYATWNGSRFDNHAIIYLLEKYGFEYKTMYMNRSTMLSLSFKSNYGQVIFKDYSKIFPGTLDKMTKSVVPDFVKQTGTYDYKKERWTPDDFSSSDLYYIDMDVIGLSKLADKLNDKMKELVPKAYVKVLTSGGLSVAYAKQEINATGRDVDLWFTDEAGSLVDRSFVAGGMVLPNPSILGKIIKDVCHYDIVSFYPYAMSQDLPYGIPVKRGEEKAENLKKLLDDNKDLIFFVKTKCSGVYRSQFSPIFKKNSKGVNNSVSYWDETEIISLIDPILRSPRLDLYAGTFEYVAYVKEPYLRDIVLKLFSQKQKRKEVGDSAGAFATKIILNSLYGKFVQRSPDQEIHYVLNDNLQAYAIEGEEPWHTYLPTGTYITAYCREILAGMIDTCAGDYLYCDTDSIFFRKPALEKINNKYPLGENLGDLSLKDFTIYDKFVVFGKKCYITELKGKVKSTIAGIRKIQGHTFEEIKHNLENEIPFPVLASAWTPQGVVLADIGKAKRFANDSRFVRA